MVAIPLESFLDSGRHVASRLSVVGLHGLGHLANAFAHGARTLISAGPSLYDVYVAIPLRVERALRSDDPPRRGAGSLASASERRAETGVA
jgi:hypothetical protein